MTGEVEHARIEGGSGSITFDELYATQWWPMLRLATGIVDRVPVAEDVVQDAFTSVFRKWDSIADPAARLGYLRRSVVNASRSALRSRIRGRRIMHVVGTDPDATTESADHTSVLSAEHDMVRTALSGLPDRQREVLTLRYIAELADAEIAVATGLSPGGVRSASSRGLSALRTALEGQL